LGQWTLLRKYLLLLKPWDWWYIFTPRGVDGVGVGKGGAIIVVSVSVLAVGVGEVTAGQEMPFFEGFNHFLKFQNIIINKPKRLKTPSNTSKRKV